ncbi:MAG: redox-regulated ATPase YchF, partial [Parcubacteria group bacterium CG08_land_8_20_14_0_20_43_9]
VRGWTVKKGSTAPQAGGAVHTDFEARFIKAQVINWKDLLDCGGFAQAREKGLLRTEGKDYVVQDGDVIEIKTDV